MASSKALIMRGFKDDCEQLVARFERADDIRFETFSEIWKEMKFSLVFTGRPNLVELLEFCEEALKVCKQFLLALPRFKERIGALYLLYGIYYKIPIKQFKIRVKLEDWTSIMDLHAEIKEAEHLDANYVLCKLIANNAFDFCIFDSEYGLEKHYRAKIAQCFNPYSVLPMLKDLMDKRQMLSKIDELSKTYEEEKKLLPMNDQLNESLRLFNSNIAEEIVNDIREYEEQKRKQQAKNISDLEKLSTASTSKVEHKKSHLRGTCRGKMRSLIDDDGFQTDSNDSEENEILEFDDSDSDIPEKVD